MNRREAIRNALMGIAISLVPKILQPQEPNIPEVKNESDYSQGLLWHIQNSGSVVEYKVGSFSIQNYNELLNHYQQ